MKLPNKQKGLSSLGWLFVGVTVFFYFTIAAKIVPIYLNDLTVQETMEKLGNVPGASEYEIPEIVEELEKHFDINNIRDVDIRKEGVITIDRDTGKVVAWMHYEKVAPIFKNNGILKNMDIVVRFNHSVELK